MATNWNKYPSQTPEAAKVWRTARRGTIEAAATRSWSRLWRKAGGKKRGPIATGAELVALWYAQGARCALTNVRLEPDHAHLDHKIPRSKGGVHTIDNLQWVHPAANLAKGAGTDEEFYVWLDAVLVQRELRGLL